mgnify:CR=1 FL=1
MAKLTPLSEKSVVGLPEGFFLVFFEQSYRKFTAADYSKSYKSVEKDLEKGIGEIGILANYFSKRLTPKIIC